MIPSKAFVLAVSCRDKESNWYFSKYVQVSSSALDVVRLDVVEQLYFRLFLFSSVPVSCGSVLTIRDSY